jgi:GNAT superfamily N-acetyltransferase
MAKDMKCEPLEGGFEISILYVNPVSQATYLEIRGPANGHVPRHGHISNETITALKGTFVVGHDGSEEKTELTPGSFGYMPADQSESRSQKRVASMPDRFVIRPVSREDHDQWRLLWDGYNAFYNRSGSTALSAEITRTTWNRFFDHYEPVHALVADRGGVLVGLAHYLFHRSTIAIGPNCYLQDLFTAEAARGKGVGRALIEMVYERARAAGSPRVYWQTQGGNLTARQLYDKVAESSGFVIYRKLL